MTATTTQSTIGRLTCAPAPAVDPMTNPWLGGDTSEIAHLGFVAKRIVPGRLTGGLT